MDDGGCHPIEIGHLSHSGDLNIKNNFFKKSKVIINTSETFPVTSMTSQLQFSGHSKEQFSP